MSGNDKNNAKNDWWTEGTWMYVGANICEHDIPLIASFNAAFQNRAQKAEVQVDQFIFKIVFQGDPS